MVPRYRFVALLLAAATAQAGGIPDPPPFDVNLVTPNADYHVGSVSSPGSVHYFPTLKAIGAALALDNASVPSFGMPNGYHAGYIERGFRQPYFSSGDRLVQFYDCSTDIEGDDDCDNGFATLGRILMPVSVYRTVSNSCTRMVLGHELFHHIEFASAEAIGASGCSGVFGKAACEGQARALQDKIYLDLDLDPEASCAAPYLGQVDNYLASTNQNLWNSSYDAALWWTYLSEQFGTVDVEPQRGIDFFVRWWQVAESLGDQPDALAITDETIRDFAPERSAKSAFHDFVITNLAKDLDLANVSPEFRTRYSYRDEEPVFLFDNQMQYRSVDRNFLVVPPNGTSDLDYAVTNHGASYSEWDVSNCASGSRIRFETDPDPTLLGTPYYTITGLLAVRGEDPGRPVHLYKNRSTGWTQELVQPFDRYDRLYSVVAGWNTFSFGELRVSCAPAPPTPQLPLVSQIHPVTPGPPEAVTLGEIPVDVHDPDLPRDPGLRALAADAFSVDVGTRPATVRAAVRRDAHYDLQVDFPAQATAGDYPLSVRVGNRTTTIPGAVRYGSVAPQVLLAVDTSTSMLFPALGTRLDAAKRAARSIIYTLPEASRLGLIEYYGNGVEPDLDAFVRVPLAPLDAAQRDRTSNANAALVGGSNRVTAIGDALRAAVAEFAARSEPRQQRHVVLLCDGPESDADRWVDVRDSVLAAGIRVHAIAFGPLADQPLLERIARETGGSFRYVDVAAAVDEADLGNVFADVADAIAARTRIAQDETITIAGGQTETVRVRAVQAAPGGRMVLNVSAPGAGTESIAAVRVFDPRGVERIDGVDGTTIHRRPRFFALLDRQQAGDWRVEITSVAGAPTQSLTLLASVADRGLRMSTAVSRDAVDPATSVEFLTGDTVRLQVGFHLYVPQKIRAMGAQVEHPDRTTQAIALNDDGERGDATAEDNVWTGTYRRQTASSPTGFADDLGQPGRRGSYRADIVATIATAGPLPPRGTEELSFTYSRIQHVVLDTGALADNDADLMPDRYEQRNDCLVAASNDGSLDADGDTRANLLEYQDGTDPCDGDSDDGGESDDSERRGGRNAADPPDDTLCPLAIAQVESTEQEHEETAPAVPNSLLLRFSTCARNAQVEVRRGTAQAGPFALVATVNAATARGLYVDRNLVPGTTYWYRLVARGGAAVGPATAPFSGRAQADPSRPLGSVRIADGRPRASGATVPLRLSLYNRPAATTQMRIQVGDAAPGPWQAFQREIEVPVPAVGSPENVYFKIVLRDGTLTESPPLVDDIRLYPVGTLGQVVARVVAPDTLDPAAGVLASVADEETEANAITAADGLVVLPALKPGTYTIVFIGAGPVSAQREVVVTAGGTTDLGTVALETPADTLFASGFEDAP
jgi:hypothetical protein